MLVALPFHFLCRVYESVVEETHGDLIEGGKVHVGRSHVSPGEVQVDQARRDTDQTDTKVPIFKRESHTQDHPPEKQETA